MSSAASSSRMSLSAVLLLALLLLLAGAAAMLWTLSRYPAVARLAGLQETRAGEPVTFAVPPPSAPTAAVTSNPAIGGDALARLAALESRLGRIENQTQQAAGSAGRADALLVAFAARRAIDRGVALGYLEPLLADRFGSTHRQAVSTIVTASRRPVRLDQLRADFAALGPRLKSASATEGVWQNVRRELGSLVMIRRAGQPSQRPSPTYDRAAARLTSGQVDQALAEAMRLPGIGGASKWVGDARTYIAAHRALDEIESAALLAR